MINNFSSENPNIVASTMILGTPQAKIPTWHEGLVGGVVTCYSSAVVDDSSAVCIAELTHGMNPRSGCQYPLMNPFENITAFKEDDCLYQSQDSYPYLRYNSVLSSTDYFSQTFPGNNLRGDEWAVAYTAFTLEEKGYTFHILIHPNEISLKNFCETQRWNFKIIDLGHS